MGESFGYAGVDSPECRVQTCRGRHCRGLSREQWVLQRMGEGEANGGGDGMDVGPMGVGSDRG
jgi:hypothetical protein